MPRSVEGRLGIEVDEAVQLIERLRQPRFRVERRAGIDGAFDAGPEQVLEVEPKRRRHQELVPLHGRI